MQAPTQLRRNTAKAFSPLILSWLLVTSAETLFFNLAKSVFSRMEENFKLNS